MPSTWPSQMAEVDHLILNARLRDEIEPFLDESVELVDIASMTTQGENEFLASMLAWERAPVIPISQWFEPELKLPPPQSLADEALREVLWDTLVRLAEKRVVLYFTDHLSDRQLYCILLRDILPSPEKKLDPLRSPLRWHCLDSEDDPQTWLRFYASDEERDQWSRIYGQELPPAELPPFPRNLPSVKQ